MAKARMEASELRSSHRGDADPRAAPSRLRPSMSLRKGWSEGGPEERGGSIGGGRGSSAEAAAGRGGAALRRRRRGRGAARERERRREGEEGAERRLNGPQTCRPTNRAGPVLVPRAASPAQARPGAWHGHGTSPNGHRPGRSRAVLSRAVPVLAQRARPSWPPIPPTNTCLHFSQQKSHTAKEKC